MMAIEHVTETPATLVLTRANVPFTVHSYDHEQIARGFGRQAAEALGVAMDRIFKSLIVEVVGFRAGLVTALVPVSRRLDVKALAGMLGGKRAELVAPDVAERTTGYVVGGISPLGQKRPTSVVIDASAQDYPTIYVSAGRRGLQVELSATELARLVGAQFAAIAR